MLDRLKYWFFNDKGLIDSAKVEMTFFSADRKLQTSFQMDYVFGKNETKIIENTYLAEWNHIKGMKKKNLKALRARAKKELKKLKETYWVEDNNQMFPSKLLVGVEWEIHIHTRKLTFKEWKDYKKA